MRSPRSQTNRPGDASEHHPPICARGRHSSSQRASPSQRSGRFPAPESNLEQVMALVPQYLASKEKQIEEARAALDSRDFGPIRRFGHNLKGTGRGYGFPPIEEMGREIERAAVEADPNRIGEQLDALHRFVNESTAALTSPRVGAC